VGIVLTAAMGLGDRLVHIACPRHGRAADCPILKTLGEEELS
jgi:hypothetical protein